jgi:hypothetical protein
MKRCTRCLTRLPPGTEHILFDITFCLPCSEDVGNEPEERTCNSCGRENDADSESETVCNRRAREAAEDARVDAHMESQDRRNE